jgi:hypothetical protein
MTVDNGTIFNIIHMIIHVFCISNFKNSYLYKGVNNGFKGVEGRLSINHKCPKISGNKN